MKNGIANELPDLLSYLDPRFGKAAQMFDREREKDGRVRVRVRVKVGIGVEVLRQRP